MAVTKEHKAEILEGLIERVKNAESIWFATSSTVTVEEFSNLRTNLREVWSTYNLAKKTLIRKAIKEALGLDLDLSTLPGQIWMICSNEDSVSGLGKVNDFIKANEEKMSWASCIFEWQIKTLEETKIIAGMPSRDTLLGRLVWSMQSPLSALARFLDAAAKEVESQGKEKVSELDTPKKEEAEVEAK